MCHEVSTVSNVPLAISSNALPFDSLLLRKTLELLLTYPHAGKLEMKKQASKTYKEIVDFCRLSFKDLEREAWVLQKHLTPYLQPPLLKQFVSQFIATLRQLDKHLSSEDLFLAITASYKMMTRHLLHFEFLADPEELVAALQKMIDQSESSELIKEALKNFIGVSKASRARLTCQKWKELPPFSELDVKEWEELVWNSDMEKRARLEKRRTPLLQRLLDEVSLSFPEKRHKEVIHFLKEIQDHYRQLATLKKEAFVEKLLLLAESLQEKEIEPHVIDLLEKPLKEGLRYSQNLDTVFSQISQTFRRMDNLPKVTLRELKERITTVKGTFHLNKPALVESLDRFIAYCLREIYLSSDDQSDRFVQKAIKHRYQRALALPKWEPMERDGKIAALLLHYYRQHPLHNTLRTTSLGFGQQSYS